MKGTKKAVICAAILFVAAGVFLILTAMAMGKANWKELKTVGYEEKTFPVSGKFTSIQISDSENSVKILPSGDGICKVICPQKTDGSVYHTVEVRDGVLSVQRHDARKWFQFLGVNFYIGSVEVYLPESEYDALTVSSTAGSISVADGFTFESADVKSISGSIRMLSQVEKELKAESTSGSVKGTLLSDKIFITDSTSGSVHIPRSAVGGECEITTTSGSIRIDICK